MKPIIGITGNRLVKGIDAFYGHRVTYTQQRYVDAIQHAGGRPIILPISEPEAARDLVSLCDGLLMTGGQDVTPSLYGEEPLPEIGVYSPPRDDSEIAIAMETYKQNKPILAICRGMQLINVALGGSLHQDAKNVKNELYQHLQTTDEQLGSHSIKVEANSILATIYTDGKKVNSLHHQFIKKLAPHLKVTACSQDSMIEAIESEDSDTWFIGVQWHPELMYRNDKESAALFQLFINEAAKKN